MRAPVRNSSARSREKTVTSSCDGRATRGGAAALARTVPSSSIGNEAEAQNPLDDEIGARRLDGAGDHLAIGLQSSVAEARHRFT